MVGVWRQGMDEDDIATRMITKVPWLPPVGSVMDLPQEDIAEGTMCFVAVDHDEEVWEYRDGSWRKMEDL